MVISIQNKTLVFCKCSFFSSHIGKFGDKTKCQLRDRNIAPAFLPSARLISTTVHPDCDAPDIKATHMVTQFGQLVDHDVTLAPEHEPEGCCEKNPGEFCAPIEIPFNDPFYSNLREPLRCMPFARSVKFCEGKAGAQKEQVNAITSFVDASNVYGSDEMHGKSLRTLVDGMLRTSGLVS